MCFCSECGGTDDEDNDPSIDLSPSECNVRGGLRPRYAAVWFGISIDWSGECGSDEGLFESSDRLEWPDAEPVSLSSTFWSFSVLF